MKAIRRLLLGSVLLSLLSICVTHAQEEPGRYLPEDVDAYKVLRFDNGFTAILNPRGTSPYIAARLIVDIGINDFECADRELPHLVEHLMFSGYGEFSESDLDGEIAGYGGSWNAFTDYRVTGYELQFHTDYAAQAVWLLWGMMWATEISSEELGIARSVVNSESNGEPGAVQQFMYRNGIFGGHAARAFRAYIPATRAWCDELITASNITLDDVERFLAEHYTPANMTLIAVGNMDLDSFAKAIESSFGTWEKPQYEREPRVRPSLEYVPTTYYTRLGAPVGEGSYASIEFGIPPAGGPDRADLSVVRNYLEYRVYEEFRVNAGLAYDPDAYITDYDDYSVLGLDATVRTSDVDKAMEVMKGLLDEIRSDGIDEEFIEHVRNSYKLRLATGFESNVSIADYYVRQFSRWQKDGHFPNIETRYDAVTPQSVSAAIGRHLPQGRALYYVSRPLVGYTGLVFLLGGIVVLTFLIRRRRVRAVRPGV